MKAAVLLDAGGVILDEAEYEEAVSRIVVEILQEKRGDYTVEDYWSDVRESIRRYCPRTVRYVLWKRCGRSPAVYERVHERYAKAVSRSMPPLRLFKGIEHEVRELSAHFLVVYAGQYGSEVYALLEECGIAGLFANQLSQSDFSITKPDPRYVEQIAARAGVAAGACVMVGDRIDKDVIPAKQNGMGTVIVKTGIYRIQEPRIPEEVPDVTLEGIEGLAQAILTRWGQSSGPQ